jgi:hypothetical protein
MNRIDSTPVTLKRKTWVTVRTAIFSLGVIFIGWFVVRYLVRLRELGYVDSAIGTMRTIAAGENKFAETHPDLGYSCALADVTTDPTVARGRKNEYVFEISDCRAAAGGATNTSYRVTARPLHPNMPAFCSDESGILKADYDGLAANCVKSGQTL